MGRRSSQKDNIGTWWSISHLLVTLTIWRLSCNDWMRKNSEQRSTNTGGDLLVEVGKPFASLDQIHSSHRLMVMEYSTHDDSSNNNNNNNNNHNNNSSTNNSSTNNKYCNIANCTAISGWNSPCAALALSFQGHFSLPSPEVGLAFDDDLEEAVLLAMSQDENLGGSKQEPFELCN